MAIKEMEKNNTRITTKKDEIAPIADIEILVLLPGVEISSGGVGQVLVFHLCRQSICELLLQCSSTLSSDVWIQPLFVFAPFWEIILNVFLKPLHYSFTKSKENSGCMEAPSVTRGGARCDSLQLDPKRRQQSPISSGGLS